MFGTRKSYAPISIFSCYANNLITTSAFATNTRESRFYPLIYALVFSESISIYSHFIIAKLVCQSSKYKIERITYGTKKLQKHSMFTR